MRVEGSYLELQPRVDQDHRTSEILDPDDVLFRDVKFNSERHFITPLKQQGLPLYTTKGFRHRDEVHR